MSKESEIKQTTEKEPSALPDAVGYAAFYDPRLRAIYLRTPRHDEFGVAGHCDHGLDHATALKLRDDLNDALLSRPHNKSVEMRTQ